jgi:hypothetical protein
LKIDLLGGGRSSDGQQPAARTQPSKDKQKFSARHVKLVSTTPEKGVWGKGTHQNFKEKQRFKPSPTLYFLHTSIQKVRILSFIATSQKLEVRKHIAKQMHTKSGPLSMGCGFGFGSCFFPPETGTPNAICWCDQHTLSLTRARRTLREFLSKLMAETKSISRFCQCISFVPHVWDWKTYN